MQAHSLGSPSSQGHLPLTSAHSKGCQAPPWANPALLAQGQAEEEEWEPEFAAADFPQNSGPRRSTEPRRQDVYKMLSLECGGVLSFLPYFTVQPA